MRLKTSVYMPSNFSLTDTLVLEQFLQQKNSLDFEIFCRKFCQSWLIFGFAQNCLGVFVLIKRCFYGKRFLKT